MKCICVLTATRAEYGLLSPLIKKLSAQPEFDTRVVVTGMHLSPEFGLTYKEIEADGIEIDRKIEMLLSSDTPSAVSKSMGIALMGFADYFTETAPDALIVLGDRYETLAVCIAAINARIPIFHIHGGEITEGAIDDAIRHCITKLSYLHFTSTEEYRKRVIQLGEEPDRVFNVGALGVENALNAEKMSKEELEKNIDWELGESYAVLTFHPVTLDKQAPEEQVKELLDALDEITQIKILATKANADAGGHVINEMLEQYSKSHENLKLFDSLGMRRYLSAVEHSKFVIGNSSSGLIEVPALGVPTVNIGDRQKGRARGSSVIDCETGREDIVKAIKTALEMESKAFDSPYGTGGTSDRIIEEIKKALSKDIDLKKKFYDTP